MRIFPRHPIAIACYRFYCWAHGFGDVYPLARRIGEYRSRRSWAYPVVPVGCDYSGLQNAYSPQMAASAQNALNNYNHYNNGLASSLQNSSFGSMNSIGDILGLRL